MSQGVACTISVITPCYNEQGNVQDVYEQVRAVFDSEPGYNYEHIFIDNASTDATEAELRCLSKADPAVKVILNQRNFGQVRSPYYALLQGSGDAVILICADLQDPPHLIHDFLRNWEKGHKVVLGVKDSAEETKILFVLRTLYYRTLQSLSEVQLVENATGFGLFDRTVIETMRQIRDPYPYFRGLLAELGFRAATIEYVQPVRKRGLTKNNFYTLYDMAMLGMTSHSKVPLRLATMLGFAVSAISLLVALVYAIYKLIFWNDFQVGMAPLVIGMFFFGAVQLFFIGIIGEYVGSIHTHVLDRPLVVERERINFEPEPILTDGSATDRQGLPVR